MSEDKVERAVAEVGALLSEVLSLERFVYDSLSKADLRVKIMARLVKIRTGLSQLRSQLKPQ
jgi:hypothetical protein